MIYVNFGGIRDILETESDTSVWQIGNKYVSILTETHINLDEINHIKNNWLGAIFYSPGDSHPKRLLVLPHLSLEGVTDVQNDPKLRFVSFMVTPLMTEFSVFMSLQGIAQRNSWLGGVFFKS